MGAGKMMDREKCRNREDKCGDMQDKGGDRECEEGHRGDFGGQGWETGRTKVCTQRIRVGTGRKYR